MIALADVAAVVVTRGDVDLAPIRESLAVFGELIVWDNTLEPDVAVYGRYAALARCTRPVVYVQDDDVILPPDSLQELCRGYEPEVLVANMPQRFRDSGFYDDHTLVGFGAIFDTSLPDTVFRRFLDSGALGGADDPFAAEVWFNRTCDIVFTGLTPRKLLDLPYTEREFASAANRMWKQPEHVPERQRMLELVRQVRDE